MDLNLSGKFTADLDQALAATETLSNIIAEFYAGLIKNGVDKTTARELTKEASSIIWQKAIGGNNG